MRAGAWLGSIALAAAALAPAVARGEARLELGLEAAAEYDDNVLFQSGDVLSDFAGRLGPKLRIHEDGDQLLWEAHYYPTYEKFLDLDEFDGWNHDAYGSVTWKASPRTSFRMYDQYQDLNRATRALEETDVSTPAGEAGVELLVRGFQQNVAYAELNHKLARRDSLQLYLQNIFTESDPLAGASGSEGLVTTGSLSYLRDYDARNRIGLSVRVTDQRFDDFVQPETRTQFYNVSLQWIHLFDRTLNLSVSAGPAYVSSDVPEAEGLGMNQPLFPFIRDAQGQGPVRIDTCPTLDDGTPIVGLGCQALPIQQVNPLVRGALTQTGDLPVIQDDSGDSGSELTYFAAVSLVKEWDRVTATARYIRDASQSVGASGNVRDVLLASVSWRATPRLRLMFLTSYERREQATEGVSYAFALTPAMVSTTGGGIAVIGRAAALRGVPVQSSARTDRLVLSFNLQYQWSRRVTLFVNSYWVDQEQRNDVFGDSTADRLNIVLGVRYYLDPIELPF